MSAYYIGAPYGVVVIKFASWAIKSVIGLIPMGRSAMEDKSYLLNLSRNVIVVSE